MLLFYQIISKELTNLQIMQVSLMQNSEKQKRNNVLARQGDKQCCVHFPFINKEDYILKCLLFPL